MILNDDIEVLNEEEIEVLEDFENVINDDKKNEIISIDRLFNSNDQEEVIDAYEEDLKKEELKQKKITKIQIGLIVFLIVFASIFYLFGYNLVEPYINIE